MRSPDRRFVLWLQGDGNLVEYAEGGGTLKPLWVRGDKSGWVLWMQGDGNVVLYRHDGTAVWWSDTGGHPHDRMLLQSDANLVVYSASNRPLFANNPSPPWYDVRNVNSLKCLDDRGPERVTQNPCDRRSGNEIFVLLPLGGDRFMIETLPYHARCLEVPNGVATPAPLRSRECVRSVSQTFRWNPVGPPGRGTFVTETSHTAPFNCVGVVGASKADDAAVAQSPCSGGSSQLWDLVPWTAPA